MIEIKKVLGMMILGMGLLINSEAEARSSIVQIKGSDTILNVSQRVVENYMEIAPKARIAVTGGGSGVGISSLINGTTEIAMASRNIKGKELELAKKRGRDIEEIVLGYDGIVVITNLENPIKDINLKTLGKIYRGEVRNWKELGGEDAPIVVLSRDSSSGTHEFFKEFVVREKNTLKKAEYGENTLYMPANESIKQEVKSNKYAIGYIGMGYMDSLLQGLSVDGITANFENISNKTYPIAREIYWYVDKNGKAEGKKLVEYVLSEEGQKIVKEEGFIPVK